MFTLNECMLDNILRNARPFGHHEDAMELNLGFGFIYYGLVRALRPKHIVVIGSGFGFSVVCLGLGLKDNQTGRLSFVDPSYSLLRDGPFKTVGGMAKWNDPRKVEEHFAGFGLETIVSHRRMTSEVFFARFKHFELPPIDVAFIDGNHSFRDARNDFMNVLKHSKKNSYVLLHDSNIYVREMIRHAGVKRWLNVLRNNKELFDLIDFPFDSGVALVRIAQDNAWKYIE